MVSWNSDSRRPSGTTTTTVRNYVKDWPGKNGAAAVIYDKVNRQISQGLHY